MTIVHARSIGSQMTLQPCTRNFDIAVSIAVITWFWLYHKLKSVEQMPRHKAWMKLRSILRCLLGCHPRPVLLLFLPTTHESGCGQFYSIQGIQYAVPASTPRFNEVSMIVVKDPGRYFALKWRISILLDSVTLDVSMFSPHSQEATRQDCHVSTQWRHTLKSWTNSGVPSASLSFHQVLNLSS